MRNFTYIMALRAAPLAVALLAAACGSSTTGGSIQAPEDAGTVPGLDAAGSDATGGDTHVPGEDAGGDAGGTSDGGDDAGGIADGGGDDVGISDGGGGDGGAGDAGGDALLTDGGGGDAADAGAEDAQADADEDTVTPPQMVKSGFVTTSGGALVGSTNYRCKLMVGGPLTATAKSPKYQATIGVGAVVQP